MAGDVEPDRSEARASDEDRDRVVGKLRDAVGDGRLELAELEERLELALSARTMGQLASLVADLREAPGGAPVRAKDLVRIQVKGSNAVREGAWIVPRALEISADMGSVTLDLTSAVLSHPTLRIAADVRLGNLTIITRPGIEVDADAVSIAFGSVDLHDESTDGTSGTVLRVEVTGKLAHGKLRARPPRPPRRGLLARLLRRPRS
ncbi:DUF1707 SHOCT-like domain-containing protein [Actinocorallia longicatena]|uniref:DUF1707 domain-containing protein n=1 Tax=Actinocorallia longicatena TaxID=111803 RepID=A0ABP6Q142_9ACTN